MDIDIAKITTNFDKFIVRPLNAFGLGGFIFDIEGDATVNLNTEITDHFTEDNVAIQDHIAVRPKKVTLRNYVGELVYRLDKDNNTPLQKVVRKLTILNDLLPDLSAAAAQAKAIYEDGIGSIGLDSITGANISKAADLWSTVKNLTPPVEKQAQAYMYFKALMEQKILVSVQTPFEFMANMAIESIIAYQAEESRYISDFTITLKQIRLAPTQVVAYDPAANASAGANAPISQKPAAIAPPILGIPSNLPAPKNINDLAPFKADLSASDMLKVLSPQNYQGGAAAQIAPIKNNGKTNGAAMPKVNTIQDLQKAYGAWFQ